MKLRINQKGKLKEYHRFLIVGQANNQKTILSHIYYDISEDLMVLPKLNDG